MAAGIIDPTKVIIFSLLEGITSIETDNKSSPCVYHRIWALGTSTLAYMCPFFLTKLTLLCLSLKCRW